MVKAKTIRPIVEKMITKSKIDNLANRRLLLKALAKEKVVKKLLEVLRIIKLEPRRGDAAKMAIIEFV